MSRKGTGTYPPEWKTIAKRVKDEAGWCCVRCSAPHDPKRGYCLTVHHLDMDKDNCRWWNIVALCQRCHLSIQHKVIMARPWALFPHTEWFKPYVAGYYAWRYAGEELTREQVMARLDELLDLERQALGVTA